MKKCPLLKEPCVKAECAFWMSLPGGEDNAFFKFRGCGMFGVFMTQILRLNAALAQDNERRKKEGKPPLAPAAVDMEDWS